MLKNGIEKNLYFGDCKTTTNTKNKLEDKNLLFENQIVPEYLPTRLAAHYLGISENALRIKVHRGQVPAHHFGRSLRFRLSELKNLFKKGASYGN